MLPGLAERRSDRLPAEVTPFVGRAGELARVTQLLRASRLVTITGTGGVGKTRLALRAATVLATSRQPLDVPGELTCPLAPMRVPGPDEPSGAEAGDALALFTQRAAAARPGFAVTPENRADVVRVCERLDGIPLAIELAAVRLRALPLRDLVHRLDRRFQVLTGGHRVRQSRHQTLHGAIAWSYDLCTPEEQSLWARLSVFPGTFDIDSAEDVCADDRMDRDDVTETIISLIDKSVVLRTGPDGERYRLLDTIREFGAEQLDACGLGAETRRRHIARYLTVARDFAASCLSDDQLERLRRLRDEDANFQAALDYALAEGPEGERDAASLAEALFPYWQLCSRAREGRRLAGKVLDRFPEPTRERASLLLDAAFLDVLQGKGEAEEEAREGTRIAEELGDERLCTRGLMAQNLALTMLGHYEESLLAGEEAERRLRKHGSPVSLLFLDAQMSMLLALSGNFEESYERCQQGLLRLGADSGERSLRGTYLITGALSLYHQPGKQRECAGYAARALTAKYEISDMLGTVYGLEVFAWLAADAGRFERAAWLLGAASVLWEGTGARFHNNEILEQSHRSAAEKARRGLARGRFEELHAHGRACSLDAVVRQALADGDTAPQDRANPGSGEPATDGLTQRENEIATLIAEGLSNREVAERLVISRRTVDAHVEHIYAKLGISNRVQLARRLSQES